MTLHRIFWPVMALIVAATGTLQVHSARGETQTWDEAIHISAGYAYLTLGDYSWNMEHPPLVKLMSAIPLRFLGLEAHPYFPDGKRKSQIEFGADFLYHNRRPADTILFAARCPVILLNPLFTLALAWWVRRRFGPAAALLTAILCAFDPNLIAHGRYVTTDVALTAFYFFACVLWLEYLDCGGRRRLLAAAAAIAVAMVVKFSAVLLAPTLALLYVIRWVQRPGDFPIRRAAFAAITVAAVLLVTVLAIYWPETVRTWQAKGAPQVTIPGGEPGPMTALMRKWHVPEHSFLIGLNQVASHNEGGHESYLLGVQANQGWWYYFPVVFAVKSTVAALLGALLLFATGVWAVLRGMAGGLLRRMMHGVRAIPLMVLGLALPPLFYFVISMTSGINLGLRHILPVYPFLYVGVAALLSRMPRRQLAALAMVGLGALQVAECASIAPDYLAFFNAPSGGPGRGPDYLVDSNIDWGQDVKKLVRWLDAHGTRRVRVYYFGNALLGYYGVQELNYPDPLDEKGWEAIDEICVASVTPLKGVYAPLRDLAWLRMREPVAKIGWSMYVYDLRKRSGPRSAKRYQEPLTFPQK